MALWRRQLGLTLVGLGVPCDQGEALGAPVQVEAAEHPPDAVL
jgi:hypothetical protein